MLFSASLLVGEVLKWNFFKCFCPFFEQIWWTWNLFIFINAWFQNQNSPSGNLKKNNTWFAMNTLIEFLNYQFLQSSGKMSSHSNVVIQTNTWQANAWGSNKFLNKLQIISLPIISKCWTTSLTFLRQAALKQLTRKH